MVSRCALLATVCLAGLVHTCPYAIAAPAAVNVVIVFPGGPDAGEEGQKIIDQFLDIVNRQGEFGKNGIAGSYFNDADKAVAHLKEHRNSFIMGSLGFFLTWRKALSLVPVARVETPEGGAGRHYLVAGKGAFATLDSMKGKTIAGNTLYEDPRFLSKVVFEDKIDISAHFELQPTKRPLSALRKVSRGTLDGVLLNEGQYLSLKRLSMFEAFDVVYKSPPLLPLGLMMIDTERTRNRMHKLLQALTTMCRSEEGREACANFGIRGFQAVTEGDLKQAVSMYE